MSDSPGSQGIRAALKEHTAIAASIVSIVVGVLGIVGYFASTGDGNSAAAPVVNFGAARFGTQQSPSTLLPAGETVASGGQVRVCSPDDLYVWLSYSIADGTAITGEWLRDDLVIANDRVVASSQQPNFWMRLPKPAPGRYAFRATAAGTSKSWDATVVC